MEKCIQDQLSLGAQMNFQELLWPNWCRVHNASHSEFECCLCQTIVEHVKGLITPQKEMPVGPPAPNHIEPTPTSEVVDKNSQPRGNEHILGPSVKGPSKF